MNLLRVKRTGLLVATGLLTTLFSTTAFATLIGPGVANIGGEVTVTGNAIFFFNTLGTTANIFDAGSASGAFAGLTGGSIKDLAFPPVGVGACDPTVTVACRAIVTFNGPIPGPIFFDLTNLFAGIGTLANCSGAASLVIGAQCTPTNSPFTLTLTNTGVTITIAEGGIAYTGTQPPGSTASGLYTAQISAVGTIAGVLQAVGNGSLGKQTYSATFVSAVPEPGTIWMIFAGLGMVALSNRKHLMARQ